MAILSDILPDPGALIYLFNVIAGFNALVIVFLFLRYYRNYSPATKFLMVFMLGMFFVNLITFLFKSTYILYVPWLFRLPSPLYYLMFPAAYLYVKLTLQDRQVLRKAEWIHFLPAVLHFFEFLPFYLSSTDYKVKHIIETMKNPLGTYVHDEGMFPPYIHNIFRGIQGVIYGSLMIYLIMKEFRKRREGGLDHSGVKNWLTTISVLILVFSLSILSTFVGGWASPDFRSLNLAFWSALALMATGITMMQNPVLMYGMPRLNKMVLKVPDLVGISATKKDNALQETDEGMEAGTGNGVKHDWVDRYAVLIEDFRKHNSSFLTAKYTIDDMAHELGIPRHHLSYVLNKVYQRRFNDFINELRINYMSSLVSKDGILKEKTLEGLAKDAGFASRITFIRAVQRITGENPSEYFRRFG